MKRPFDWFLPGMFMAVVLAWILPDPGAKGGWLHPEILTKAGIALIFFLHGAALSFAALKVGTLRWPVHLVVQGATFLLFPLIGLLGLKLLGDAVSDDLKLGLFYLCALPSTVSSSVALTAAARGHVAVAVFNATLSSLLGVFLTPFWMGWMIQAGGEPLPMGKVVLDLGCWLVLPLVLGQCARPWVGDFITRHKKRVHLADRMIILLLVYTSFCDSMKQGVWSGHGGKSILIVVLASIGLFFLVLGIVGGVCDALKFPVGDRIAAVFCGSKKTLASGVPMAQIIFAGHPGIGLILLPIMVYHPLQLVLCGWLAGRWARRPEVSEPL
jgi:sodium/bile acid cotransporter 7